MSDPFGDLTPGPPLLGRYLVVRKLGEGSTGVVYLAEDLEVEHRQVALKVLSPLGSLTAESEETVRREILLSSELRHSNIVQVSHFEPTSDGGVLVMDYVDGRTLTEICGKEGPLAPGRSRDVLLPICRALDHAHAAGVAHGDIRANNIMVDTRGTPFLLDFGLAKALCGTSRESATLEVDQTARLRDLQSLSRLILTAITGETLDTTPWFEKRAYWMRVLDRHGLSGALFDRLFSTGSTALPAWVQAVGFFEGVRPRFGDLVRRKRSLLIGVGCLLLAAVVAIFSSGGSPGTTPEQPAATGQTNGGGEVAEAASPVRIVDSPPVITARDRIQLRYLFPQRPFGYAVHDGVTYRPNASGVVTVGVDLDEGLNRIGVKLLSAADRVLDEFEYMVERDSTPPDVQLSGAANSGKSSLARIVVTGVITDRNLSQPVFLNKEPVELDEDGRLSVSVDLEVGENRFEIQAKDRAGNGSPFVFTVVRIPPENTGEHHYSARTGLAMQKLEEEGGWEPADPSRNPRGYACYRHVATGLEFVLVPEGVLRPRSDPPPARQLTKRIPAYLMCRTECTQGAWIATGGENPSRNYNPDRPDLPVENVNWRQAWAWCESLGLRLPSESEWEYACRAGTATPWWFGEDESLLGDRCWYKANSQGRTRRVLTTLPAGNPFGLCDLYGNVAEWCDSDPDYYGSPAGERDATPHNRPIRGGCYDNPGEKCTSFFRALIHENTPNGALGFRPACSLPLPR